MATSLHAKAGRLPSGVSGRKPSVNRRSKQSRTVGEVAMTSAGAACATEVNSVAGPVAVTLRLTPRPMGQPRSGRERRLMLELHASKWRPCSSEGRGCWQQHLLTRLSEPRLGRDLRHLVNTVQDLSDRGVGLKVLSGQGTEVDTTTASGKFIFGIFAALAEFERELIRE